MTLNRNILRNHPLYSVSFFSFIFSSIALGLTPTFVPLILLIATLRIATRIIINRPKFGQRLTILIASLTLGVSYAFSGPGSTALSSSVFSIVALVIFSTAIVSLALVPLGLAAKFSGIFGQNPFIFPLLWSTWWWAISAGNPVGHLGAWSPMSGMGGYEWLRPYGGAVALDWIVGAWAELLSEFVVTLMFMGDHQDDFSTDIQEEDLPQDIEEHSQIQIPHRRVPKSKSKSFASYLTLLLLVSLAALPSTSIHYSIPLPILSDSSTRLGVACALPQISNRVPPFESYLEDTMKLAGLARVVLWPEGAIAFNSQQDKDLKINATITASKLNGIYIGLSFTEPDFSTPPSEQKRSKMRNGLMLINGTQVVFEYYKRHLVPVTETFSQEAGEDTPPFHNISIPIPVSKSRRIFREIPITASVCLDFAYDFPTLPGKPGLILAPARTWDPAVGLAMYQQARARAQELGSVTLWCDGGEGGFSGVLGLGHNSLRRGLGSWAETVGVGWPYDDERTLYAKHDGGVILAIFALLAGIATFGTNTFIVTLIVGLKQRLKRSDVPEGNLLGN